MSNPLIVEICMGSSCSARGNNRSLPIIQQFLQENGRQDAVELKGCLCKGLCKEGPIIVINGEVFTEVEPGSVRDILHHALQSN